MEKATTGSVVYEAAYHVFIAAGKKFHAIEDAYQARKINDDEYLEGRAAFVKANERFDAVERI